MTSLEPRDGDHLERELGRYFRRAFGHLDQPVENLATPLEERLPVANASRPRRRGALVGTLVAGAIALVLVIGIALTRSDPQRLPVVRAARLSLTAAPAAARPGEVVALTIRNAEPGAWDSAPTARIEHHGPRDWETVAVVTATRVIAPLGGSTGGSASEAPPGTSAIVLPELPPGNYRISQRFTRRSGSATAGSVDFVVTTPIILQPPSTG